MAIEFTTFHRNEITRTGVLAYVRVSSEEQADRRASLEEQRRRIKEHFEGKLGLRILEWYADEGASAFKDDEKRENFWRMIERAKSDPAVGIIAVDEESRFYRNRYKASAIKGELLDYGIRVLTVRRDADPRTVAGLWQESIEETMAHAHSLANREYTLRGMAGNVRQRDPKTGWAYKNGGPAPYGWRAVRLDMGRDGKGRPIGRTIWELDEEAAKVRRQILLWRMDGWSISQIRDELNRRAIPAPRQGLWSQDTIAGMLREDMVWTAAGYAIWNKHYRKHKPKGVKFKPTEEWVVEPNAHPNIISEEEARAILAINEQRRQVWKGTRGNEWRSNYLLSGDGVDGYPLFICLRCGGRMIGHSVGPKGRQKYICSTYSHRGRAGCVPVRIDKEQIEGRILEYIRWHMLTEDFIRSVIREANERTKAEELAGPSLQEKRLKEVDRQLQQIKKAILAGDDPDGWVDEIRQLRNERNALEAAIAKEKAAQAPRVLYDESKIPEVLRRLQEAFDTPNIDQQRRFLRSFVRQIAFDPDKRRVTVEFMPNPTSPYHPLVLIGINSRGGAVSAELVPPRGFEPLSHG